MTSREFCYWLQGFFEVESQNGRGQAMTLNPKQCATVAKHLSMVFKHEIDPSYPDGDELSKIHNPEGDIRPRC